MRPRVQAAENGGRRRGRPPTTSPGSSTSGWTAVEYVGAVLGLLVTAGGVALLYPSLPSGNHPLGFLAITALVGGLVLVWLAVWTCVEVVRSRRGGHPNGS